MQARLKQPLGAVADAGWRRQRRLHHMVMRLHSMEKVTIAAVNGPAAGLGADLALCCDFIIAAPEASFVMSFILRGLVPDGGGMYFLPRRIGLPKAKELIFTGRRVGAEEAVAMGMADRLAAPGQLLAEATAWAAELTRALVDCPGARQIDPRLDVRALAGDGAGRRGAVSGHRVHHRLPPSIRRGVPGPVC